MAYGNAARSSGRRFGRFIGGDLAAIDDDGWVWRHGRNDDLMNAFGYRVSPLEVEKVLEAHPDIADAAVAERKVAEGVSVIVAFVAPRPDRALDEVAVLAYCAEHLAAYNVRARWSSCARSRLTPTARSAARPCRNWREAWAGGAYAEVRRGPRIDSKHDDPTLVCAKTGGDSETTATPRGSRSV